jgi:AcrR family transcriptional regulator
MGRVYAGRSAQQRADTRRRQFMDAGLEMLGKRGWPESTVRGVCDEAGLSTRFFYESFDGLEALALAIYDEIVDETIARVVGAIAASGSDRDDRAHAGIEAMVSALTEDPRRARVVLLEAHGNESMARRRIQTMHRFASVIAMLGRAEYGTSEAAEPRVQVIATFVAGGVSELMIAWLDGSLVVPRERLIDECARLVVGIGDTARVVSA